MSDVCISSVEPNIKRLVDNENSICTEKKRFKNINKKPEHYWQKFWEYMVNWSCQDISVILRTFTVYKFQTLNLNSSHTRMLATVQQGSKKLNSVG